MGFASTCHARIARGDDAVALGMARHHDNRHIGVRAVRIVAHAAREFDAVHRLHRKIGEHEIRLPSRISLKAPVPSGDLNTALIPNAFNSERSSVRM